MTQWSSFVGTMLIFLIFHPHSNVIAIARQVAGVNT
jgi:hypothetical protein